MNVKRQYKSELESVTLLGPDGPRLIHTACKLSILVAGMQAVRTLTKFVDPTNPSCRWRRKRVPKWRRSGPLPGEPSGVSLSLFSEALSGTARSCQGRAV